eukprot:TRINITY_DN1683_c0_g1_i1.p1 TRINITY_DN1683_c0_g1~~TRINITY_DN1683_c0_g1_i1.p1  ORF type:complete len:338 (+),score=109.56 TRINITY_DN1683_c0_g1_i1:54-1067(+)
MGAVGDNSFLNVFKAATVADLVESRKILTVKPSDSVDHVLSFLADNRILSAPVINDKGTFVGLVDVKDVLDFIVGLLDKNGAATLDQIKTVEIAGTVDQILDVSPGYASAFLAIKSTEPAVKLIEVFANSPFHRVVCFDPADPSASILVTRSDIMRFLYKKLSYGDQVSNLALLCDQNIETCKLFSFDPSDRKTVYGIKGSSNVITGLRYLKGTVLSALPIVSGEEKDDSNPKIADNAAYICKATDTITGIFTASLLKGFTLQQLPWLTTTVAEFSNQQAEAVAQQSVSRSDGTIRRILELMHIYKLHRVWVLEDAHPIGVVTAGDIIRWFYSFVEV